ncbi:class I SAM-dependent methyltransferase [uncultured Planktomarina sp.]|jgi:2-polyprenyl-3-methyl-5-hydroxy-6-metoxy-1,4-benzoquinol methylase|uniref:class I SAM-dependent methyltransferase n=1 Tax=uncultured Planktomarina sp. TaxID=1538529 RepID=UPI0032611351
MTDAQTLAVYDAKIDDYLRLTQAPPSTSLLAFIKAIPEGGQVLDLGCGPGLAAAEMARHGCDVEAIDGSAEMVAAASKHSGVTARQATFDELPSQATYHGIYANFSLLHAKRTNFNRHIQACYTALHPGGILHLAMKLGTGEKRDELGRFYTYYTAEELKNILTQAGFTLTFQRNGQEKGLAGDVEPFIMIAAHA